MMSFNNKIWAARRKFAEVVALNFHNAHSADGNFFEAWNTAYTGTGDCPNPAAGWPADEPLHPWYVNWLHELPEPPELTLRDAGGFGLHPALQTIANAGRAFYELRDELLAMEAEETERLALAVAS